ncbi:MAG: hypothetical protein HQ593_07665 [Candidatus Omnitrophica bacterium]|nr:hypothetical protein [Candidatus Omnitrophota bacterium]
MRKVYDEARTPHRRLLESGVLTEAKRQELEAVYHGLNPVLLLKQINGNMEKLWALAGRPAPQPKLRVQAKGGPIYEATMPLR